MPGVCFWYSEHTEDAEDAEFKEKLSHPGAPEDHEKFKLNYPFSFRGMNFLLLPLPRQSVGLSKKIHLSK